MASRNLVNKISHTVYVGKLPWTVSSTQLLKYFSQFGDVVQARVFFNEQTGFSKHFGFVTYRSGNDCNQVLQMVHQLEGSQLEVARSNRTLGSNQDL